MIITEQEESYEVRWLKAEKELACLEYKAIPQATAEEVDNELLTDR